MTGQEHRPPAPPPEELPGMGPETGRGPRRRVERAVEESLGAAKLTAIDRAAGALAQELARAVDVASVRNDPYGVSAAGRELREQLIRLRLDPVSRGETEDAFGKWLDSLDDDEPAGAPVAHP